VRYAIDSTISITPDDPTPYSEIVKYLNRADVQATLGTEVSTYESCSDAMGWEFSKAGDLMRGDSTYLGALLDRGVRVLLFAGDYDFICNWIGNDAWARGVEWSGQEEFSAQPLVEWAVDGKRVGKTRSARRFTFATVEGAGHMVRYRFFNTHRSF
jgi:carboxypeptidase C (cathepsin A)